MKYCGIDLHSNNSVVSVLDEQDHVVAEKRLPNDLAKIIGLIKPWRTELAGIVVESTFNWYWLVDGLKEAGFTVYLAHTTAIKKYESLSTAAMNPMHATLRICCDWEYCQHEPYWSPNTARYAIWPGNACSWCAAVPRTSWQSKTSRPVKMVRALQAISSSS